MKRKSVSTEEIAWLKDINDAAEWRKKYSFEHKWYDIERYYRHDFEQLNQPHFNLIYMMGNSLIPSLVYQTPGIMNLPRKPNMMYWASFFDSVDNWWMDHAQIKALSEEAALTSFLYNTCAFQIGYDFSDQQQQITEVSQNMFADMKGIADSTRKTNLPWVDFIYPQRFLVAKGTRMMKNCRWAAKFVAVPTRMLKDIKGLQNVEVTHMPDMVHKHERSIWEGMLGDKEKSGYTCLWEIHNAEDNTWCWLSTEGKYILPPEEDPLQVQGLPFEVISFNKSSGSIWSTPDSIYIESQQLEGDETRRVGRLQRKLASVKFLYDADILDKDTLADLLSEDPCGIPVKLPRNKTLHDCVLPLQTNVQTQFPQYSKELLNDAQLILGIGPNQFGTFAPGRRTKYETQVVEGTNQLRTAMRRDKLATAIQGMVTRANILITKYWQKEMVQQVVGVDGALYWVEARPEEFQYATENLISKVNVDSMAPTSRDRKKAEAAELLSMLSSMQEAGVNPLPVLQQLLSTFEWLDVRQVLPQVQDQMTMQAFTQNQQEKVAQGRLGDRLTQNLGGVNNLVQRVPQGAQQEGEVDE